MLRITHLKWLLSLLIPAGAYFAVQTAVQADPSLNPHLPMFFAITLWAITVWATDILPAVPSAAAMTFLYLLCNVAPAPVIFGAWGAFLPWICFGALILSEALEQTGLTRRLALQLMHLVGATFTRIVVSLMTVGMFMAFLLPDIMCRVIIFVAIAHGLVMALELDPKSRISSAIIMAGFCSATSPGYGFLTGNVRKLNVGFLVFIVACLGMGSVAVHLGAAKWFASLVVPLIDGLSPIWLVLSSYLSAVAVNFMLTPLAAVSALSLPWAEIAQHVNMNPLPMLYSFLYGLDQYIFPYEYALYMYIFSTGYITPKHMFKGLGLRILFVAVILMLLQVPYWKLIGLM